MTRQRWQLLLVSPADNVDGVKNRETGDEQLSEECLMRVIIIILVVTIITFMIHNTITKGENLLESYSNKLIMTPILLFEVPKIHLKIKKL